METKQMCSDIDDAREIMQLWNAAQFCYSLVPKDVDAADMDKTVREWSDEYESSHAFHVTPLFIHSVHLTSCAIRLYSIDEKRNYQRYQDYQRWWNDKSMGAREFSTRNTGRIIHCVLRNVVAHNEKKAVPINSRFSYEELKNYYYNLRFYDLHQGMKDVINSIAQDLKGDGIVVVSFA